MLGLYSYVGCCSLEQLELIEYVIAENLADILKSLTQLKTFSLWTNTETRVRRSVLDVSSRAKIACCLYRCVLLSYNFCAN